MKNLVQNHARPFCLLLLALLTLLSSNSFAYTHHYNGLIYKVTGSGGDLTDDTFLDEYLVGSNIHVSFSINTGGTSDIFPSLPHTAYYSNAITYSEVSISTGQAWDTLGGPAGTLIVNNWLPSDTGPGQDDEVRSVQSATFGGRINGTSLGGIQPDKLTISLLDPDGVMLGSDAPPLSSVTFAKGYVQVWYSDDVYLALQFTPVSNVPVPAAVWLFGSGLIGLIGIARRKKS